MTDEQQVAQMAKIIAMHPEINWCQAAGEIIGRYFNGDDITFADFEEAYAIEDFKTLGRQTLKQMLGTLVNPGGRVFEDTPEAIAQLPEAKAAAQKVMAEVEAENEKSQLIENILAFMVQSPGATDHMRSVMSYWTKERLQAKLQEVIEKTKLQPLSTEEIRQFVADNDQVRRSNLGRKYPFIPVEIQAPDIKRMPSAKFQRFLKIFGSEQVTARVNGWDKEEQKLHLRDGFDGRPYPVSAKEWLEA